MHAARDLPVDERAKRALVDVTGFGEGSHERGSTSGEPLRFHPLNLRGSRREERVLADLRSRRQLQHIAHREHAFFSDKPAGGLESAFGEYPPAPGNVSERQLLESSV